MNNLGLVVAAIVALAVLYRLAGWSTRKSNAGTLALAGAILVYVAWSLFG